MASAQEHGIIRLSKYDPSLSTGHPIVEFSTYQFYKETGGEYLPEKNPMLEAVDDPAHVINGNECLVVEVNTFATDGIDGDESELFIPARIRHKTSTEQTVVREIILTARDFEIVNGTTVWNSAANTVTCTAGQFTKLCKYRVPEGWALKLGWKNAFAKRGAIYMYLGDDTA